MQIKRSIKGYISLGITIILLLGAAIPSTVAVDKPQLTDHELLDLESRKCFDFFWNEATTDFDSPGYGLIRDRVPGDDKISSIASVGFGLTALVIGVERGWITYDQGHERALGTLHTLLNNVEQVNGFFYHFVDMDTAKRAWNCEVSVIDTAIALNGAITAGEYFGGEIKEKAQQIYERVDWNWYRDPNRNQFYMGYSPENGFSGWWDFYAEQFMLYFLGAASPTHPVNANMFYDFIRNYKAYGDYPAFIHSWFGSLFTHQFSYAWFDMRNKVDREGVNWWRNSVIASKVSRQFSIDNADKYRTFGPNSWGLTACDGPDGYSGLYGTPPSGFNNDQHKVDGTVPPAGAAGSIVFTPQEVIDTLQNYYNNHPDLWGKYGFNDAYNLDVTPVWYAEDVIGIDKGITLLMIENYRTGLVWDLFMKNKYVQAGMKKVGLVDIGTLVVDDFEGNSIHSGWTDGGDGVYTFTETEAKSYSGLKSLKVDYNKRDFTWPFLSIALDNGDLTQVKTMKAKLYGNMKVLVKLETSSGAQEKTFTVTGNETWNELIWNLGEIQNQLVDVQKILFFVDPGEASASGTFYIDDIEFLQERIMASNALINGQPIVGETLKGTYDYFDAEGRTEGESAYRWLTASAQAGEYQPITGATSDTYIVQQEDIGKYIRFEVTPRTAIDETTGQAASGNRVLSEVLGEIKPAYPAAKNVTIIKQPVKVEKLVDNFDSNPTEESWIDSGDKVYSVSLDNSITPDGGGNALKIEYDKNGNAWAFVNKIFDKPQDFSDVDTFSAKIYGNPKMLIKFESYDPTKANPWIGLCEKWIEPGSNQWNEFIWDISQHSSNLDNVKRILLFAEPIGENSMTGSGTFYIDDIKFTGKQITDVTTIGIPVVGEMLIGSYEYQDANGDEESGTIYRWLRADSKDGQYIPIPDETSDTYIPKAEDIGKYLKFEVTPKTAAVPTTGETVQSAPSNAVAEGALQIYLPK
ncbi:MAG: hypothetical protein MJB12_12240 [Firmicutes bacterium]|nr:hypothetical protein [Bacillota bacterium]